MQRPLSCLLPLPVQCMSGIEAICAEQEMKEHVAKQLDEHRDNAAMSQPGKEWVRGWDDWNSSQGSNAMRAGERKA